MRQQQHYPVNLTCSDVYDTRTMPASSAFQSVIWHLQEFDKQSQLDDSIAAASPTGRVMPMALTSNPALVIPRNQGQFTGSQSSSFIAGLSMCLSSWRLHEHGLLFSCVIDSLG